MLQGIKLRQKSPNLYWFQPWAGEPIYLDIIYTRLCVRNLFLAQGFCICYMLFCCFFITPTKNKQEDTKRNSTTFAVHTSILVVESINVDTIHASSSRQKEREEMK